jgi:polysaccharide deacetylase 2 family uncharacterized protein YibQ
MPGRKRKKASKKTPGVILLVFIIIALLTVILLEYLDYKKGKPSFIFTKILPTAVDKEVETVTPFNSQLQVLLQKEKVKYDYLKDRDKKHHYKIEIPAAHYKSISGKIKKLIKQAAAPLKLELAELQRLDHKTLYLYNVKAGRETTHIILITAVTPTTDTTAAKKRIKKEQGRPRVAFVIDDIGNNDRGALQLKQLNIPITGSVLPHAPYAYDEARQLHLYGLETMIHLPMQRINSHGEQHNPQRVITLRSSDDDIRELLKIARQRVPYARGANNHEGSLATSNKEVMRRVMGILKKENLFFLDSRTSPRTVAYRLAKQLKIKTAERDVFLEDIGNGDTTYEYSLNQIKKLIQKARQKGKAIAIGHPYETTFRAIRDSIPRIKRSGIDIVYVSTLLE